MAQAKAQSPASPRRWSSFFFRGSSSRSIEAQQEDETEIDIIEVVDVPSVETSDVEVTATSQQQQSLQVIASLPEFEENWTKLGKDWLSQTSQTINHECVMQLSSKCDDTDTLQHIQRDVPRTFSDESFFKNPMVRDSLESLLRAITTRYRSVGYVQGLNFVAGYILVHSENIQDGFQLSCALMEDARYNLAALYEVGFKELFLLVDALSNVLEVIDAKLSDKLNVLGLGSLFFVHNWILTLFTYSMPFENLKGVWSYFIKAGWPGMLRVCIALILSCKETVMNCSMSQDTVANQVLSDAASNPPCDIVELADSLVISETLLPATLSNLRV